MALVRATILAEVSRRLVRLLESALSAACGADVPVYLSHPLDPLGDEAIDEQVIGLLYPVALRPARMAANLPQLEGSAATRHGERLRFPGVWLDVRYLLLASGGRLDDQLALLETGIRTFHDTPYLSASEAEEAMPRKLIPRETEEADADGSPERTEPVGFPLRLADATGAWNELGLPEHRLAVACEVTVELPSARSEAVERTLERAIDVQET